MNFPCANCAVFGRYTFSYCVLTEDIDLSKVFPILCHGDDADSHRRRSFTVLTIGSPLSRGRSSWDERFLIYVMDVNRSVPETYDCLDAWVVHPLTELQEGRFMTVDAYGQPYERSLSGPICGPYRGVLLALKGDQKYLQRALKLTTSWVSDRCCMYCDTGTSGPNLYTFFGEHAPHRATLKTTHDFIVNGSRPNYWVRCPGFDISMVFTDWLHLVDVALTPEIAASVNCLWLSLFCFIDFPLCFGFTMFYLSYLELVRIVLHSHLRPLWSSSRATTYGRVTLRKNDFDGHMWTLRVSANDTGSETCLRIWTVGHI